MTKKKKKFFTKKKLMAISLMIFSQLLSAVVYNLFLLPTGIVTGGISGIATITNFLYKLDPAIVIYFISAACIALSFLYLEKEESIASIAASILYPTFVKLTQTITNGIYVDYRDLLVIALIAGTLSGISNGLMYKSGYNSTGVPTISKILNKYFKIPIASSTTIINGLIVILSCIMFGWSNIMYAIIILYINGIIINKVLLGISNNKAFYIITSEDEQIKEYIIENLGHGVTIFDVKGGFKEKKRNVILTVIPTKEYYKMTAGIKEIDKDAFFLAVDSYEVVGAK